MRRLRSLLAWLVPLLVLVGVVWWLATKPVVRYSLGPADELIAEPGIDSFLLRVPDAGWSVHTVASRTAADGRPLPGDVIGRPALLSSGSVIALTPEGLLWVRVGTMIVPGGEQVLLCPRDVLPDDVVLEGTIGGKDALLSSPVGTGRRLFICPGSPTSTPALYPVMDREGPALVPAGAPLLLAREARAVAFLGPEGWEAWTVSEAGFAERAVAFECTRPGAIFTPDGRGLIVPGKVNGIDLLRLDENTKSLMCGGNIGVSRRVPQSWAFQTNPLRLYTPQWDLDGWLQIAQIHVPGPSSNFNMGGSHHYGVAMSKDERTLAYVQAVFDEEGDQPFAEDVYLFGFDRVDSGAEQIDSREGGRPLQGPCFIGEHSALVYLAGGEAIRIDIPRSKPATAGAAEN